MKQIKSMKRSLKFSDQPFLKIFVFWRIALFFIGAISPLILVEFGGRFPYYQDLLIGSTLPNWVWAFANFDGVHYLTIANSGYSAQYTQAFFPLYPILIKLVSYLFFFINIKAALIVSGLVVSNGAFLISMYLLYKLFKRDFSPKVSFRSVLLWMCFPTAFYFLGLYSESVFLLFSVSSLLLMRRKQFVLASLFILLASGTRIFGIFLLISLLFEIWINLKSEKVSKKLFYSIVTVCIGSTGLGLYMIYLQLAFGDPLYFINAQPAFGAARTNQSIILLPQVIFRYTKIFLSVPVYSISFLNSFLEFIFTLIPLGLLPFAFKKIRTSYLLFVLICIVVPTLTGTLSSMPRYALLSLFMVPFIVTLVGKYYYLVIGLMLILQVILAAMFLRGYWVA